MKSSRSVLSRAKKLFSRLNGWKVIEKKDPRGSRAAFLPADDTTRRDATVMTVTSTRDILLFRTRNGCSNRPLLIQCAHSRRKSDDLARGDVFSDGWRKKKWNMLGKRDVERTEISRKNADRDTRSRWKERTTTWPRSAINIRWQLIRFLPINSRISDYLSRLSSSRCKFRS